MFFGISIWTLSITDFRRLAVIYFCWFFLAFLLLTFWSKLSNLRLVLPFEILWKNIQRIFKLIFFRMCNFIVYSFVPNCRGGGRIKCPRGKLSRFLKTAGVFLGYNNWMNLRGVFPKFSMLNVGSFLNPAAYLMLINNAAKYLSEMVTEQKDLDLYYISHVQILHYSHLLFRFLIYLKNIPMWQNLLHHRIRVS